ncbi:MAG: hypothetical protein M8317_00560 [Nitrosopumilus sp.]|nr:hypothetical protein [Nitrosopumilus sp.]
MQGKLAGFGILSLFLIMLVPVYGEVTEFSIEKNFYTIDEGVVFVGDTDEEREQISITIVNPNGKESLLTGTVSNIQGEFETMAKSVEDSFSIIGMYELTAFTTQKDNGIKMILEFDGNSISEPTKYVLQLNSIRDKIAETETTVSFTASITDSSITNAVYNLENAPVDATIDPITGKFIWTPSKSYGSFKDVIYNFDIIVKHDNQEDRENISITVKKAYDEPVIEPNVEPVIEPNVEPVIEPNVEPVIEQTKSTVASFVDQTKDPQSYVNRYNDEPTYKEWFDENYSQYSSIYEAVGLEEPLQIPASFVDQTKDPQSYVNRYNDEPTYKEWFDENYSQYSSIYEAVGLEEPEFGICGDGTKLINGICTIIQKMIEKPWWQFW